MRVTVLGNSSRYLVPLGTGASYLVEHRDTRLLLDPGNGTALKLAAMDGSRPHAVVVSHFHQDYVADLFQTFAALPAGTNVFLAERARGRLNELIFSRGPRGSHDVTLRGVDNGSEALLGDLALRFVRAGHGCPGVAVRIAAREEPDLAICYLPDTGSRPWFREIAHGARLLLAHALLLDRALASPLAESNLTAGQVARLAQEARASAVALSLVPLYGSAPDALAEVRAHYSGSARVLREGETVEVEAAPATQE